MSLNGSDNLPGEHRGDYGYDAPYALVAFSAVGIASLIAGLVSFWSWGFGRPTPMLALYALFFLGNALSFYYTTRHGKFHVWNEILDGLRLRGDERVLDMGCGRGAVLNAVARRLNTGRVTGIDLWSTHDQSGNARNVTLNNASLEGVQDRIDIDTGDMRALPFPEATFDLVVSSLAIHNIRSDKDRAQAIAEAWRAQTRRTPGDCRHPRHRQLRQDASPSRASGVARRGLGWRFWYGNPMAHTSLVTASKP
jgi:SAM-dependent methyltransferase